MSFVLKSIHLMVKTVVLSTTLLCGALAWPATIYVDVNATGSLSDGSTWANAFTDIQSAIDAAESGDEVWIATGVYTGDGDNVIELKEGIDLYGGFAGTETERNQRDWTANETIIDGENTRRGIYVDSPDKTTIDGFTIRNGNEVTYGGGIYIFLSPPIIMNCSFIKNTAKIGGGMYNRGRSPVIKNCVFSENTAQNDGGGISGYPASLVDCIIENNSAALGGGMHINGAWIITRCTITKNTSTYNGGGIHATGGKSELTNCTISMNTSGKYGAGICYANTIWTDVIDCYFTQNHAEKGGALYFTETNSYVHSISFSGCIFSENTAMSHGGAIYDNNKSDTVLNMKDCLFNKNETTGGYGGGIYIDYAQASIVDSIFNENKARYGGGGIGINGYGPSIFGCNFSKNYAYTGGGVYNMAASPILDNCKFYQNEAKFGGGGIHSFLNAHPKLTGCLFLENKADSGGGMYNTVRSSPILTDCSFNGNKAYNGGGMCNDKYCSPKLSRCFFATNKIIDDYRRNVGGGMYNRLKSHPQVSSCIFDENTADLGGGMYNYQASPTIIGCIFTGNIVDEEDGGSAGGGIYNDYASPKIESCYFRGNHADRGGSIYNENAIPSLENCLFIRNKANRGTGSYDENSTSTLTCCTFTKNEADKDGVIYCNNSFPTISNCIIWSNRGHGIYTSGDSFPVVSYSCIQDGYEGEGNIKKDPLFIDISNENFQLAENSPCLDTGTTNKAPSTDILGKPRPHGLGVDMGAYESYINNAADPVWLNIEGL